METKKVVLQIEGMSCLSCAATVEKSLSAVPPQLRKACPKWVESQIQRSGGKDPESTDAGRWEHHNPSPRAPSIRGLKVMEGSV